MFRIIILLAAVITFAGTDVVAAYGVKPASGVVKTVLKNGLTILVKESKANDVVSLQLLLGMGAKFESDEEAGISRLLQQSMLKGTRTRSAEDIANEIESVGGRIETGTTKEVGFIRLTCTSEGLPTAQKVFFDVVENPAFPPDEVDKEKDLIIKTMRQKKDRLLASAVDLAQEALYGEHPFHKPGEGYEETVESLGREQVVEAYKRFYSPENMVIVAVGNLDGPKFANEVKEKLGKMKAEGQKSVVQLPKVSLGEKREELKYRKSSSVWLVIAFPTPGILDDDYLAVRVLDSILGGSMNSRLFTELRDKRGLGYQVGSFFANYSRDAFVGAYIGTAPDQFEIARDGILEEIAKVRSEGVTDEELENTKKYLRGTLMISLESNANQAHNFAYYESIGAGYDYPDRYLESIREITKDDVMRVARAYFGKYALAGILPEIARTDTPQQEEAGHEH